MGRCGTGVCAGVLRADGEEGGVRRAHRSVAAVAGVLWRNGIEEAHLCGVDTEAAKAMALFDAEIHPVVLTGACARSGRAEFHESGVWMRRHTIGEDHVRGVKQQASAVSRPFDAAVDVRLLAPGAWILAGGPGELGKAGSARTPLGVLPERVLRETQCARAPWGAKSRCRCNFRLSRHARGPRESVGRCRRR